jgi:hypothetical protein
MARHREHSSDGSAQAWVYVIAIAYGFGNTWDFFAPRPDHPGTCAGGQFGDAACVIGVVMCQ